MMDFEAQDGSEFEDANLIQPSGNAAPPAVARSGATQVLTANAQGVVVLPDGISLENIQIEGRNLVIIDDDGTRYIIIDGAIVVPQLVLDGVAVPAANLAALLLGNEPEPAAGNPQSSGGNFAGAVDDIQAAFDLGNLLPYTELAFPADEEREVIPDVVDREPDIAIEIDDSGVSVINAVDAVNEAGLPARNGEPAGSNSASNSESTYGFINFDSPDGTSQVTLNGVAITQVGQTFTTPLGVLRIDSIADGRIGYGYTLTDNTTNPASMDNFAVTITDSDGDMATATLRIDIIDDVPTARNDTDSVPAATFTGESGNVLTGAGTTSGAAGADTPGADGITVTGIVAGTASTFAAPGTINGQYGTLSINAQGNYTYTRSPGSPGGVTDVFTYRITDGDGDTSTATLTITIADAPVTIVSVRGGNTVDEEGLPVRNNEPAGSNEPSPTESTTGTITFVAPDGVGSVAINGTPVTGPGQQITTPQGTLTIDTFNPGTGTLTYTFTLGDNTSGDSTQVNLTVTVTDVDGDFDTEPFVITIIDDQPTARADADSVTEDGATVADGNVITGSGGADVNATDGVADTQGADGASVSAVAFGATSGTVGSPLAGSYGSLTLNANGSYSYALNNAHPLVQGLDGNDTLTETFSYTLTDGDGDPSSTTLTITINGANDVVAINGLDAQGAEEVVDEDDLPDGSSPDAAALTQSGTFTIDSQDGLAALTINGTPVFGVGVVYPVTFPTAHGTMSITGVATTPDANGDVTAATVSYSYTLTDNTLLHTGANGVSLTETFAVAATDSDGSTDTASLDVTVVDDLPTARSDADSVTEDVAFVADGNVIAGSGGADANATDGVADTQGADGATVTAVAFGATNGTVGNALAGAYGSLTLNANGSYTYTLTNGHPLVQGLDGNDTLTEIFNYRLTDGDGDSSSATLTISINGTDDGVVIGGLNVRGAEVVVYEDDLADGSSPDASQLTKTGTFTVDSQDGLVTLTVNGTAVFGAGVTYPVTFPTAHGTMSITGVATTPDANGDVVAATVSYSYTLTDNTLLHTGANDGALTESLAVAATDTDGSTDTANLDVTIVDDVPTAAADADSATEDGPTVADGNVITGSGGADVNATDGVTDTQGADGATVTAVAFGATNGTVGNALAGTYGSLTLNADGSYAYTLNSAHPLVQGLDDNDTLTETFDYTLTDGDGDASATTLTITINGADDVVVINGLDTQGAEEFVYEDDLADGSSPDAGQLTQSGTFTVESQDGLAALTVNGTPVFGMGVVYPVTFPTAYGTMSITGVATTPDANGDVVAATVSYSYTLTDNTLLHTGGNAGALTESFAVAATDTDGSTDTASLDVTVVDDVPTAAPDTDSVTEDGPTVADGNVLTGSGGADVNATDGVTDTQGADGATVTAVAFGATPGTVGGPLAGAYGSLTLSANGGYSYTLNSALVQGLDGNDTLTEIFSYTLTDGDGDASPTTLTITINGADDVVVINGLDGRGAEEIVYEDDLANGSSPDAPALTQTGTFDVDSPDGLAALTVNGTPVFGAGVVYPVTFPTAYGTMSITGVVPTTDVDGDVTAVTVSYSYTLTDNTLLHTGANDGSLTESLAVEATDSDGSTDTASLDVTVVDDLPDAIADAGQSVAEDAAGTIGGNVRSNDVHGADEASVTHIDIGGGFVLITTGADQGGGVYAFTNANGTYTIAASGAWTFDPAASSGSLAGTDASFSYRLTDGDGDYDTAAVPITITDGANPTVSAPITLTVDDQNLANGTTPAGPDFDADTITFTPGSDPITSIVFGTDLSGLVGGLTWTRDSDTQITGKDGADTIVTLTLGVVGNVATVTATLSNNYDSHPTINADDLQALGSVGVVASEADGDAVTGIVNVAVSDDLPDAIADTGQSVAEDAAGTIGGNVRSNDVHGADEASVTHIDIGGGFVLITTGADQGGGVYAFSNANGTYTIAASGVWTFDPAASSGSLAGTDASFSYRLTDGDGDYDTAAVPITITDGANPTVSAPITLTVDDQNLANGTTPAGPDFDADTITFTPGSDPITSIVFGTDLSGLVGGLTWTRDSDTQITGKDGADTIVTLTLGVVGNVATVTATLSNNYDSHPTINADDLQALGSVGVVASEADGDAVTGIVNVAVSDDLPDAIADTGQSVAEDAAGTIGGNVRSNDVHGADEASVTHIDIGGGFVLITTGADQGGGVYAFTNANGTYTIAASGVWTFDPAASSGSLAGTDASFSYRLTDGDGDYDTAAVPITITDGANPTVSAPITLTVDDQNLANGTTPAGPDFDADTITFTPGSDPITSIVFGTDLSGLVGGLTWTRDSDTQITGKDGADTIVTLTLGVVGNVATVTATLSNNYDSHPTINVDDLQALGSVGVVASEADGDAVTGIVNVAVSDDLPDAIADAGQSVAEDAAGTIGGNVRSNDVHGADEASVTHIDIGGGFVLITTGADQGGGVYAFTNANGTYTIAASGAWTFDPAASSGSLAGTDASFSYRLTDGDGDYDTAAVPITITDGANPTVSAPITLTVDDQNLANGTTPAGPDFDADTITFTPGSDPITSIVFGTDLSGLVGGLTWTRDSDTQITGKDGADTIVTLTLGVVGNVATVTATLSNNYDSHPTINADDLQALGSVGVVASEADGDAVTGIVNVAVSDDLPDAIADTGQSVAEDAAGTIGGNVRSNDVHGADEASVTHIDIGGGFVLITTGADQGGGVYAFTNANGTYTIAASGVWTFDPAASSGSLAGTDASFSYRLTDGDGDYDTAAVPITITDGANPTVSAPITLTVDDQNLANGTTPAGPDFDADTITFTPGSDPITSIVFGTDLSGLVGGLTWTRDSDTQITGKDGADTIVTLTLGVVGNVATVTATLSNNYDSHPTINADDLQALGSVGVVASEADGDAVTGIVNVAVSDDLPDAIADTGQSVAEDAAGTIGGNVRSNDVHGADEASVTHIDIGGGFVLITTGADQGGGVYAFTNANGTYTIAASGAWTFDPAASSGSLAGTDASFSYRLTDGDGDYDTAAVPITITDGANPTVSAPITLTVDDQNLANGTTPAGPDFDADTITFTPGSDPITSIVFGTDLSGLVGGLTWTRDSDTQITGKDGADTIVTLTLGVVGNVATVTATLSNNYDSHPTINADDLQALGSVGVVASEADGDAVTGIVNVAVSDDLLDVVGTDALLVDDTLADTDTGFIDYTAGADDIGSITIDAVSYTGTALTLTTSVVGLVATTSYTPSGGGGAVDLYKFEIINSATGEYKFTVLGELPDPTPVTLNYTQNLDGSPITAGSTTGIKGTVGGTTVTVIPGSDDIQVSNAGGGGPAFFGVGNNNFDAGETLTFQASGSPDSFDDIGFQIFQVGGAGDTMSWSALGDDAVTYTGTITVNAEGIYSLLDDSDPGSISPALPADVSFEQVVLTMTTGSVKFGLFGSQITPPLVDVDLEYDLTLTDGDGDSDTATVTVHVNADGVFPPIVVDLDGDGAEFVSLAAGVAFDYDGDGSGEATAWADGDDGLLAIDLDGDGSITSGAELVFGNASLTDLEGLAARYDGNQDGVLDAQDASFAQFGVWQDGNENGVSEAGEFRSLGELGISSIGLTSDGEGYVAANGDVRVDGEATVTRNGTTYALADAAFATAPIDRRTAEVAVAAAVAGALVAPELAAALAPQPSDEQSSADTFASDAADTEAEQTRSGDDAASAKRSDLLEDNAPDHAEVATSSRHSDDASSAEDLPSAPDADDNLAAAGTSSEAVADFAASSGALFQFDGGEGLMEALLISASADAEGLQTQNLAPVREALAEVAEEAAVDAIVSRFADADVAATPIGAEVAGSVLLDALDVQLVFAANGAHGPDVVEDAAQLAAATQA